MYDSQRKFIVRVSKEALLNVLLDSGFSLRNLLENLLLDHSDSIWYICMIFESSVGMLYNYSNI